MALLEAAPGSAIELLGRSTVLIEGLGIVVGDPAAPGETDDVPPGVEFKRGYFADLEAALRWRPAG